MTPIEAQTLLRENGFHGEWHGRHLVGGSEYIPGNPGKFEGTRFTLTLINQGVWEAEIVGLSEEERVKITASRDGLTTLEAITGELISRMQYGLEHFTWEGKHTERYSKFWLGVQMGQVAPNAKSDVEALTRLFLSEEQEAQLTRDAKQSGLCVAPFEESSMLRSEEALLRLPLGPVPEAPAWKPLATDARRTLTNMNVSSTIQDASPKRAGPTDMLTLENSDRSACEERILKQVERSATPNLSPYYGAHSQTLAFTWAPLAELEAWPKHQLRYVHYPLGTPREMSTVLLISALCQIAEQLPPWLDLVMFTTEPVDGKVTACFYGSKPDLPPREKPEWLQKLVAEIKPRYATSIDYAQLDARERVRDSYAWRNFWQKKSDRDG